ncbi:transcription initiation factor TFIID subunit 4-like [Centruroides vittatus]|uniref:transcription initiation factor TFIID subunit 4-like n=1 Tax=Centruroides vittatus TaxID=120091 RepID=UPI00350EDF2D
MGWKPTNASNLNQQLTIQTNTANGQVTSSSQMSPTTAKKKCKNFLSTLLRLANGQAGQVAKNVEKLIQGIIDDTIQPEEFSHQLQKELNSSPQPYLIPFLKKNLPYLRHSMMTGELSIEGIKPPPPGSVVLPIPQPVLKQVMNKQVLQMKPPITQMRVVSPALISGNLSAQLTTPATQTIVGQRLVTPKLQGGTSIKTIAGSKSLTGILNQTTKPVISSRSSVSVNSKERERDKKGFTSSLRDDDDINDVAAMGGVNLIEESQRILATTAEIVGTQIRSCKDETFFSSGLLQKRISKIAAKHGVDDVSSDVIALVSHAAQERLKSIIEKLGTIAAHYVENPKLNSKYEITSNVKDQLAFLEEVDRFKMSNTEEMDISNGDLVNEENPRLSKEEDKRKEDERQTETILSALGSRKRSRTDFQSDQIIDSSLSEMHSTQNPTVKVDKKVKHVTLRDLLFVMELERQLRHSPLLYKSYVK